MDLPFRYKIIFAIRRWQYALLNYSNIWFVGRILKNFSDSRFADRAIGKIPLLHKDKSYSETSVTTTGNDSSKKIITHSPEDWSLIGLKTILAFKYVLKNYDFDFLFRTNTSSYLDVETLFKFLEGKSPTSVYRGVIGRVFGDTEFASGAGILLSRDVVERICERENDWKHGLVDDIAIAELISQLRNPTVPLMPLPRMDLASLDEAVSADPESIKENFHFRCKTDSPDETIKIMKYIHKVKYGSV